MTDSPWKEYIFGDGSYLIGTQQYETDRCICMEGSLLSNQAKYTSVIVFRLPLSD